MSQGGTDAGEVIDLDHLRRMALADPALEREVLQMFAVQAGGLIQELATLPANAAVLAHTLKGSARAIGAARVAEAAAALEAAMRTSADIRGVVARLTEEVERAQEAISSILAVPAGDPR